MHNYPTFFPALLVPMALPPSLSTPSLSGPPTCARLNFLHPTCCLPLPITPPSKNSPAKERNPCQFSDKGKMLSFNHQISPGNECASMSDLMIHRAENGHFLEARALWGEILNSCIEPNIEVVSLLIHVYARMAQFEEIHRILDEISMRGFGYCQKLYSIAVCCFGEIGQLDMMEATIKEMVLKGYKVDSVTGNAFVIYYSLYGSIMDTEYAYKCLKKSRILIEKESIRAMASAYIGERKFYKLGEFLRDVGLSRRNIGNLLWNLLLLSYAANFKMKSLQREFLNMVSAGFSPDLTTFNIRALAFSRMCMFWDLHLGINHMLYEGTAPDLVTYGCVVDAYLSRRLGKNLSFALEKLNVDYPALVLTDPLVFEVFGKGDFHSSSEVLMESTGQLKWTYARLISRYLKKQYRSNQIFWNY